MFLGFIDSAQKGQVQAMYTGLQESINNLCESVPSLLGDQREPPFLLQEMDSASVPTILHSASPFTHTSSRPALVLCGSQYPKPPLLSTQAVQLLYTVLTCTIKLVSQPVTKCVYPLPMSLSIFPPQLTRTPAAHLSLSIEHSRFVSICSPPSATFTQNHSGALALWRVSH